MTFSILIVDDHPLVAAALMGVLRDLGPQVTCSVAHSGMAAKQLLTQQNVFGLIVLDLALPDMDGFAVLAHLRECYARVPVIVVSASGNIQDMQRAIAAGAKGYVAKSESPTTMLKAAESVLRGEVYLSPGMGSAPLPAHADHGMSATELLSARQLDVLRLLCVGRSNKIIAYELGPAEKTVKGRVTAIYKALGVVSRMEAVLKASKLGLFAPPEFNREMPTQPLAEAGQAFSRQQDS